MSDSCRARVRRMLAAELGVDESNLADEFRWMDEIGKEDLSIFLNELNDAFTQIPDGFSWGAGNLIFPNNMTMDELEDISTVRGLLKRIERYTL